MLLQSLYDSIKTEPFKIPEDDGNDLMHTFFNPDKEGWLWKQGKIPTHSASSIYRVIKQMLSTLTCHKLITNFPQYKGILKSLEIEVK